MVGKMVVKKVVLWDIQRVVEMVGQKADHLVEMMVVW
jgi:hypothetical protein